MSTKRPFNFGAGPATLPLEVLTQTVDNFMDFDGMSILEISHRSGRFAEILNEAKGLISELLELPKGYDVLFLQGGAAHQFAMVPLNLMDKAADFSVTGHWSKRALSEASEIGKANVVFSSEDSGFSRVPKAAEISVNGDASYLHITTNNTIFGTQYFEFPDTGKIPLVADASSDFLSRRIDISRFGLIYAGAQKNAGPAGVTVVIVRHDLLDKAYRKLPAVLKYSAHARNGSLFNTPPVFAIYVLRFFMLWLKGIGGVEAAERRNREKAALIYDVLDRSDLYRSNVSAESRSMVNVTFSLPSVELTERFISGAKEHDIVGIRGHRLTGGVRASMYNAFPVEGARALVEFMKEFEKNL